MHTPRVIAHSKDCPGSNCPTTYAHPTPGTSYLQGYGSFDQATDRQDRLRQVAVEAPAYVIAAHLRAVGMTPATASDDTVVRVHGRVVADPLAELQLTIPEGEALVEVSDTDLAEALQAVASGAAFAEALRTFERFAWRLEARDHYVVPEYDAQIRAFEAGEPMPARADGWEDVVGSATARGARIGRVRLVGRPITAYTRWEFAVYADNVELGEDVQVVDRAGLDASWDAAPDAWLFDDHLAFRQRYSEDGAYLGVEQVDAEPVREMRDLLAARAVPLHKFRLTDIPSPRRAIDDAPAALPPLRV